MLSRKLIIDRSGRIVLPKAVRDELHLEPGDTLQLDRSGEKIILRPTEENAPLRRKRGVWVYSVGKRLAASVVEQTMERVRNERAGRNLARP